MVTLDFNISSIWYILFFPTPIVDTFWYYPIESRCVIFFCDFVDLRSNKIDSIFIFRLVPMVTYISESLSLLLKSPEKRCQIMILSSINSKFFIMSTEFYKNISDWSLDPTDHKNGNDFFMGLIKWPKIAVKKSQTL